MDNSKNVSRRNFIKKSSIGLGAGMVGVAGTPTSSERIARSYQEKWALSVLV